MSNRRRFGNVPHILEVNNCADLCHKIKEGGWGEDTSNLQRALMLTGICCSALKMIASAMTMAVIDFSLQLLENKYYVTTEL